VEKTSKIDDGFKFYIKKCIGLQVIGPFSFQNLIIVSKFIFLYPFLQEEIEDY
jgi:hypothetical protein